MATATEFLAQLAADTDKLGQFLKDPETVLDTYGVADDDRDVAKCSVYKEAHEKLFVWASPPAAFVW